MPEYSRPLGDAVKKARLKSGMTQKQIADLLSIDERTVMNIERYRSNTTIEILYPLIRLLKIDARDIFNPEMSKNEPVYHQLRTLIDDCSPEEAEMLVTVYQAIITTLRSQGKIAAEK